jgi:hypothetical protein
MSSPQQVTFGASIVTKEQNSHSIALNLPEQHLDSPVLTPVPSIDGSRDPERSPSVGSPFYEHPAASHEFARSYYSNLKASGGVTEKELENGDLSPVSREEPNPFTSQVSVGHNKECKMWPSKQTLLQTRAAQKQQRRANRTCAPLRDRWVQSSKRQRLMIKIAAALFVVGIAVAIGVGISLAVGGTYYKADGSSSRVAA